MRREGSGPSKKGSWRKDDSKCETMDIVKGEKEKKLDDEMSYCTVTAWHRLALHNVVLERDRDEMGEVRRSHVL